MTASVVGVIPAKAATEMTTDISWFAGQNGNPWSGAYWTYLTGKDGEFEKMENYISNDSATANFKPGWSADENATTAYIGTWRQQATQDKWAVTSFEIAEEGNITGTSNLALKTNGAGSGDVMVVLKNEGGFYPVWPSKGEWQWQTVADASGIAMNFTTGYKAGDSLYYIVKPSENEEVTRIEICPNLTFKGGTVAEYPTSFEVFGGMPEGLVTESTDIGWFATQGVQPWSGSHWTFEYFDTNTQTFQQLETFVSESSYWTDLTGKALVKSWEQLASHEKYSAVAFTASQKGLVTLTTTSGAINGGNHAGEFMLLQRRGDEYHILLDWVEVAAGQSVTLPEVNTYVQPGEILYWITRSNSTTQQSHMSFTPKATYTYGAIDTESIYPTEWDNVIYTMNEQEEYNVAWYAQQNVQPWSGSPFTFEYYSLTEGMFKQLEVYMEETTPHYWQSLSGASIVKGWEQRADNKEYAAIAVTASDKGVLNLTTTTGTIVGGAYDGQFIFVQRSGDKYYALTEWIDVPAETTVTMPEVMTYVNAGDVVYYVYKSSHESGHMFQSTPSVLYIKGIEDVAGLYPTEWKDVVNILGKEAHVCTPDAEVHENIKDGVSYDKVVYCAECGEEISRETVALTDSTLKINGATLQLENDISVIINSKTTTVGSYKNPYIIVAHELENGAIKETRVEGILNAEGTAYVFRYEGVEAKQVGDSFVCTIYAYDENGYVVTGAEAAPYSAKAYCTNTIAKNIANTDASSVALVTLLVDLLNYSAEAQKYFGYKLDALVNADLSAEVQAKASSDSVLTSLENITLANYETIENPTVAFKGATLELMNKVYVKANIEYSGDMSNVKAVFTVDGVDYEVTEHTSNETNRYSFVFDDVTAFQLEEPIYIKIMDGDTVISNTARYSVGSYAAKYQTDATVGPVVCAMMKYGKAAYAYMNAK